MVDREITCSDCFGELKLIGQNLTLLRGDIMKIVYALLGLVAANFGLKYLGTPWYLYLFVGASIVTCVFLLCVTISSWKKIPPLWKILGLTIAVRMGFVSFLRAYCYSHDIPLFQWAGAGVGRRLWRTVLGSGL